MILHCSHKLTTILDARFGVKTPAFNAPIGTSSIKMESVVKFKEHANSSIVKKAFARTAMKDTV